MSDLPPEAMIRFQLSMLDAYEQLLARCPWDKAGLNERIKVTMLQMLPLLHAQWALGEQMLTLHKEMLAEYRRALEATLARRGGGSR